jgi:predicted ATP-grasp superfamily ATP-dependent carboligase
MANIFVYESLSAGAHVAPGGADRELLAAGLAMRDAIVDDLSRLEGMAVTCAVGAAPGAGAASRPGAADFATATAREGESAEAFVGRMAATHDRCWIVAPETGGELARLHAVVGEARWIGCDAASIRCASSKRACLAVLAAAGVPTPLDGATRRRGRWVVKPDDGAGSLSTRVYRDHAAALAAVALDPVHADTLALQPFVEGEALSISMIVGADLATAVSFNRQRIEIDSAGRLRDLGVQVGALDMATDPRIPRLDAIACATARALPGLGGFVGIDVVWNDERGAVVIEVNPRVTCAYVGLSEMLGRNLAADILRLQAVGAPRRGRRDGVRA